MGQIVPDLVESYLATLNHLSGVVLDDIARAGAAQRLPLIDAEVGALPTLIGAEYTFSFQNMNIERGLLWNQENAVNRGIQLNDTYKKLSVSFSWNDGFYSNRYSWLWGSLAYAFNSSNTLSFVAGGNAGAYAKNPLATPLLLNNEEIYNLLYTYSHGHWVINPYLQYTNVPKNASWAMVPVGESGLVR